MTDDHFNIFHTPMRTINNRSTVTNTIYNISFTALRVPTEVNTRAAAQRHVHLSYMPIDGTRPLRPPADIHFSHARHGALSALPKDPTAETGMQWGWNRGAK